MEGVPGQYCVRGLHPCGITRVRHRFTRFSERFGMSMREREREIGAGESTRYGEGKVEERHPSKACFEVEFRSNTKLRDKMDDN